MEISHDAQECARSNRVFDVTELFNIVVNVRALAEY